MHISGVSFDRHTPKHGNLVVCPSIHHCCRGVLSVILYGLRHYLVFWSSCPSPRRGGFRLFFLSFLSVCNFRL
ncbi:hypothetical protein L1887_22571 [Cichorium endivia]|nr:hypothetical protein L1887_22571 [Cichorium endivia]